MNDQRDPAYDPDVERRNMRCGVLHGAFFKMGTTFADPHAVVPLFLAGFTCIALSEAEFVFTLAFSLTGAAMSAMLVGFGGYVLELGHAEIRPLIFALEGTLLMPLHFMPLAGGILSDQLGYRALILSGCMLLLAAVVVAWTLCEPRRGDPACGPFCGAECRE